MIHFHSHRYVLLIGQVATTKVIIVIAIEIAEFASFCFRVSLGTNQTKATVTGTSVKFVNLLATDNPAITDKTTQVVTVTDL